MNEIVLKEATDSDLNNLEGCLIKAIKTDGNNSAITDKGLESISKIIGLEELDLEWASQITDQGLEHLSKVKTLKYLDLSFCSKGTVTRIQNLKAMIPGLQSEQ